MNEPVYGPALLTPEQIDNLKDECGQIQVAPPHDPQAARIRDLEVALAQVSKRLAARLKTQADVQALAKADALLGVRR